MASTITPTTTANTITIVTPVPVSQNTGVEFSGVCVGDEVVGLCVGDKVVGEVEGLDVVATVSRDATPL